MCLRHLVQKNHDIKFLDHFIQKKNDTITRPNLLRCKQNLEQAYVNTVDMFVASSADEENITRQIFTDTWDKNLTAHYWIV